MTTQVLVKKLNKDIENLRKEMDEVKKVLFASLEDSEGEYKASFIKEVIRRSGETPSYRFNSKEEFLKDVRSQK